MRFIRKYDPTPDNIIISILEYIVNISIWVAIIGGPILIILKLCKVI